MKSQIVDVSGRGVRVYRAPANGPSVVLIHGASGSGATWPAVAAAWSWADVWAPSLPGRDGSDAIDHERADQLADWLWRFVEAEVSPPVWLVGHSLGGAIALTLALRAPSGLSGIAMVASSARLRVAPAILEAAAASSPASPMDLSVAFGPDASSTIRARYTEAAAGLPTASAIGDWMACDSFDVRDQLDRVALPAHVVWGSHDVLTIPKHQRRLVEALPRATACEYDGHGHMLPWEAPEEVADAVRTFCSDHL